MHATLDVPGVGLTVAEILAAATPAEYLPAATVFLRGPMGDEVVPRELWARVRPKAGVVVTVGLTPMGGGKGKNPFRMILQIALIAGIIAFPQTGPFLKLGLGTVSTAFVQAGVAFAGNLAINAIAPPAFAKSNMNFGETEDPMRSITGASNNSDPFGVVPRIYGRVKLFPMLGAQPYTETVGDDQYLRMLFDVGVGPLEISNIKIGQTAIGEYNDVDLEVREGYADDDPITLFTEQVAQEPFNIDIIADEGAQTVTSGADADEIGVDLLFREGLVEIDQKGGGLYVRTIQIKVESRLNGSADPWSAAGGILVDKSEITELSADNTTKTYRTDGAVDGVVNVHLTGGQYGPYTLVQSISYKISTRNQGATRWAVQWSGTVEHTAPQTAKLVGTQGKVLEIKIERRNAVSGTPLTWAPEPGFSYLVYAPSNTLDFVDNSARPVRKAIRYRPGAQGKYDVRITRVTADATIEQIRDVVTLVAVKTITYQAPLALNEPHALIALYIRASNQLHGVINQLSCVATSVLPEYNTATQTWGDPVPTRNPAAHLCDLLRGAVNANAIADARIDLDTIWAWGDVCAADAPQTMAPAGLVIEQDAITHTYDAVTDSQTTVFQFAGEICAAGRASFGMRDGKYSVVHDRAQTVPVQMFGPRNSRGFRGSKTFAEQPHAVRARFIDETEDYQNGEVIVYDDGYDDTNATDYVELRMVGHVRAHQVWRHVRQHLAEVRLRPETYELETDVENLRCNRGDLVRVAHDVIRVGIKQARISTVTTDGGGNATDVSLDDEVAIESGPTYGLRLRAADGTLTVHAVTGSVGDVVDLTFDVPIVSGSVPVVGDLAMFGETDLDSDLMVVKRIAPAADLAATITLVDYAAAIFTADTGTIPARTVNTARDPSATPPELGELLATEISEIVGNRRIYGIRLDWRMKDGFFATAFEVYRDLGNGFRLVAVTPELHYEFSGLGRGEFFKAAVIGVTQSGVKQAIGQGLNVVTAVAGEHPQNVTGFDLQIIGDQVRLVWEVGALTVAETWRIRWAPVVTGATWELAVDVLSRAAGPGVDVPARTGTYLIKAADEYGVESVSAAALVTTVPDLIGLNVVEAVDEHGGLFDDTAGNFDAHADDFDDGGAGFAGTKTDLFVNDAGVLQLNTAGLFDDTAGNFDDATGNFDLGAGTAFAATGSYDFDNPIDLGAKYTARISVDVTASAVDYSDTFDVATGFFDSRPGLFEGTIPDDVSVAIEIATTDDDPTGAPTWAAWAAFAIADYTARAFKFRAVLASDGSLATPLVSAITVAVDMPDRVAAGNNILAASTGTVIAFPAAFKARPAVAVTVENMATGDRVAVSGQSASGFTIQVFDSNGQGVDRTFDYVAKGYGLAA